MKAFRRTFRAGGQAGLSLPEVLVYVAVSGIVLAILTMTLRNMNSGFIHGAKTVRLQQDAREAINIMTREIRNTGLKRTLFRDGSGAWVDSLVPEAWMSPADSSSLRPLDFGRFDGIAFRQARIDRNGMPLGVDTVTYSVDSSRQMLRRKVNDGPFEDFCPNVDAVQFRYGVYGVDTPLVESRPPAAPVWASEGSASLAFSSTRATLSLAAGGSGGARHLGGAFAVDGAGTYVLEIDAAGDAGFFANGGCLTLRILGPGGSVRASERFLPGMSLARRRIEIAAPDSAAGFLSIGISATGPAAVRIASIRFGPSDRGRYLWVDNPTPAQRKSVRAVRIMLMSKAGGDGSGTPTGSYPIGNATVSIRDSQPRRYFEEDVPIPNNGVL